MNSVNERPILVVDDDEQMRKALNEAIRRQGRRAVLCANGEEGLRELREGDFGMIVTDMKMPKMDGLTFLKEVRRRSGNIPVLVITGFGTVENAVETMKEGATDYLIKPFTFEALGKAIETVLARTNGGRELVTANPEMQKLVQLAANLAANDITVLITGESGTGKELLARAVHQMSRRKDRPFVAVNCAAIPENLLESELFGHEKGAFTGATERKKGKLELADGGTILLDEIGEMPLLLQAKLLRVLQEREVDRVGGSAPVKVDVRVIATTNRELAKECREGRFREDLYYRLNVFPLRVPPLRERPEDIPALASHFIGRFASIAGRTIEGCGDGVIEHLQARPWRGNVRELENVIQRAVFLCGGSRIEKDALLFDDGAVAPARTGTLSDMEKDLILRTLDEVQGNKAKAARILGISVRTVRNKLHEYGLAENTGQNLPVG